MVKQLVGLLDRDHMILILLDRVILVVIVVYVCLRYNLRTLDPLELTEQCRRGRECGPPGLRIHEPRWLIIWLFLRGSVS